MAAEGSDISETSKRRVSCIICLEPYEGRHPKLLSCFHTFCSPCLTRLAEGQSQHSIQTSDGDPGDEDDNKEALPITITCPTCRSPTTLPPGGVAALQTSLYVDDSSDQDDLRPSFCDLCEEGQEAKYSCTQCLNFFCSRCTRSHSKLCQLSQVTELKPDASSEDTETARQEVQEQTQMVENVLKKLTEEEERLGQERKAAEQAVHMRYVTLLRHVGEARDVSLESLREVTMVLSNALHDDINLARNVLGRMKQNTTERRALRKSSAGWNDVVIEASRRRFEELVQKNEKTALLRYTADDSSTDLLLRSLRQYMGFVVTAGSDQGENFGNDLSDLNSAESHKSLTSNSLFLRELPVTSQEGGFSDFPSKLKQQTNVNGSAAEFDSTQRIQMADLATRTRLLQTDAFSSIERQQLKITPPEWDLPQDASVSDLAAKLKQLIAVFEESEKQLSALRTQNNRLSKDLNAVLDKNAKLSADVEVLQNKTASLQEKVRTVDKHCLLNQENQQLRGGLNTLHNVHKKLSTEVETVKQNVAHLTQDIAITKTVVQLDTMTLRKDIDSIKQNVMSLESDVTAAQGDNSQLKEAVKSMQDSVQEDHTAISDLAANYAAQNLHVSFHAKLSNTVSTGKSHALVCSSVISSEGDGYDEDTGIFTAPVSGTYLFLVTSSPLSDDINVSAELFIVLEEVTVGFLCSYGKGKCTGQAIVQVEAGERVWLRTGWGHYTFRGGLTTTFSGMLVRPEL